MTKGMGVSMKLLEYQAKQLFAKYGLNVQKSTVLDDKSNVAEKITEAGLSYPLAMKAQVQVGGRGKAGGIRFAEDAGKALEIAGSLLFSDLKGFKVNKLLVEERADIKAEWYLSILLDRDAKSPRIIFSANGGVEIEETAVNDPDSIASVVVNPLVGVTSYTMNYLCSKSGIGSGYSDKLREVITRMYSLFMEYSCILVEINPLVVGNDDELLALDGKVEVDDSALYRLADIVGYRDSLEEHPLVIEARAQRFLYIPLASAT